MTDNHTRVVLKISLKHYFLFLLDRSRKFLCIWWKSFLCFVSFFKKQKKFTTWENTGFHCFHEEGKCMFASFNGWQIYLGFN